MKLALPTLVLLSPWLLALWVGLHNLRQPRQLQMLTWTTPSLAIGGWVLLSTSLGVTLGATTVGVLMQTEHLLQRRRSSQASSEEEEGPIEEQVNPEPAQWRDHGFNPDNPITLVNVPFRVVHPEQAPDAAPPSSPRRDDWEPPQSEVW